MGIAFQFDELTNVILVNAGLIKHIKNPCQNLFVRVAFMEWNHVGGSFTNKDDLTFTPADWRIFQMIIHFLNALPNGGLSVVDAGAATKLIAIE